MEVISFGKALEIAREKLVTLVVGDTSFNISCTPENLRELGIGFLITEGLVTDNRICVNVKGDVITVKSVNLEQELSPVAFKVKPSGPPRVFRLASVEEKFTLEECCNALKYLETDQYKRTRGYHTAVLVGKDGLILRAYDVGRLIAIDKVIGMGIEKNINFEKVFLLVSGRISEGMALKCVRCRIPLLVSKAAILDSAVEKCMETGLSAVSFASRIAVKGEALTMNEELRKTTGIKLRPSIARKARVMC